MTEKEIVQALRCTSTPGSTGNCEKCPYWKIEQLTAEQKERLGMDTWTSCDIDKVGMDAADLIERLTAENAKAEAERDAALADLADARSCKTCKYACDTRDCSSCKSKTCKCRECHLDKNAWEWRGLPEAPKEGEKGMKAVLISIRPKWCEKIISGEKTIEVRKTRPKLNPPFKCYIYKCGNGKIIGEFLCDQIIEDRTYGHNEEFYRVACMSAYDAAAYAMQSPMYGWHISNLKIYDTPRELREFYAVQNEVEVALKAKPKPVTRPPQSWRYVEEQI